MVTWDEVKRKQNLKKHGIDLADSHHLDSEGDKT